jgi:hypothetical protein
MDSSNPCSHTDVVRLKTCVVIERTRMVDGEERKTDCNT